MLWPLNGFRLKAMHSNGCARPSLLSGHILLEKHGCFSQGPPLGRLLQDDFPLPLHLLPFTIRQFSQGHTEGYLFPSLHLSFV